MRRYFNTAGPCQTNLHYMLSPFNRLPELMPLIEQRGYFVLHAPRQTGKTTAMMALAQQLTASGNYTAIVLSVEMRVAFKQDPERAQRGIISSWWGTTRTLLPRELRPPKLTEM
jgi:hypothetical protein